MKAPGSNLVPYIFKMRRGIPRAFSFSESRILTKTMRNSIVTNVLSDGGEWGTTRAGYIYDVILPSTEDRYPPRRIRTYLRRIT